ncbi:MAG: hydroxymyristoyl-ACP dehydratase [Algibacter sp.]|uniref:3-hydroxyacyl-ACP dehydratase FabZ family protein n=1 Tax=Algibacter sp. TaxID=1872428 RepID=UPI002622A18D|nr:hydroxymyristoyl-ACP dehydratase [Algibacter sp.]MDG1730406.1 hydroxymyristoyl-ACP dehydratase [Algibacter sp.]MDG2177669.1 hydroxymyristoyl-ACP dehydratase [Algibacter sp.]
MKSKQIIKLLPYQKPFLFVDGIDSISEDGITGHYTFKKEESFYKGHFINNPITPGVILTECMAQIGLVCLGIYLLRNELNATTNPQIALTSHQMDFYLPVLPDEKVTVISEKEVFRFNKLRCNVKLLNIKGELVARGKISGMIKI